MLGEATDTPLDYDELGREALAKSVGADAAGSVSAVRHPVWLPAALNFPPDTLPGGRYDNLNAVFRHANTGAVLYIGDCTTAETRAILDKHGICRIVNCREEDSPNCFSSDPSFRYLRFQISNWWVHRAQFATRAGTLGYFKPLFSFVESELAAGNNVLIHCLAGAHRAGTAGVAVVMHLSGLPLAKAQPAVQRLRPIVNPIGTFPELLGKLDKVHAALSSLASARAQQQQPSDHQ